MRSLHEDIGRRVNSVPGKINLVRRGGFDASLFGRMLAKIAHAYAVAELGDSFQPLLTDAILGKPTRHLSQFVGGGFADEPSGTDRNEIEIKRWAGVWHDYWVVRLRLFADLGMSVYLITAGEPTS